MTGVLEVHKSTNKENFLKLLINKLQWYFNKDFKDVPVSFPNFL